MVWFKKKKSPYFQFNELRNYQSRIGRISSTLGPHQIQRLQLRLIL